MLFRSSAKNTARIVTLSPVTINMCWASDKNPFAGDLAVLDGFRKIAGNEKVTVTFPRDSSGTLLGSGDIMNEWESGKLDCATVSPDASILGLRSAKWNPAEQILYASSMVVAVVNPQAAEIIAKYAKKEAKALTFADLLNVAGKNWTDLDPGNAEVASWGTVKGHATDCARSASCQVAAVELAYSASGQANPTGRERGRAGSRCKCASILPMTSAAALICGSTAPSAAPTKDPWPIATTLC